MKRDRLFVPLTTEYWDAFNNGSKLWEVRNLGRNFSTQHVRVGRAVELRKGYSTSSSLWGVIHSVVVCNTAEALIEDIPFNSILPNAKSKQEAIKILKELLGTEHMKIAFKPEFHMKTQA